MQNKLSGIISVDFDATYHLLIYILLLSNTREKKWEYSKAVHELFIYLKKAYDSVRKPVFYLIFSLGLFSHESSKAKKNVSE
jgi:hypothetical protein